MHKLHHWAAASFFAVALSALAGEFPDTWTYDKDAQGRAGHAALEGKPMPPLDLTG